MAACGKKENSGSSHVGTYALTDEKFTDRSGNVSQEWKLVLNDDGTGKSIRQPEAKLTGSVEGEKLKASEEAMSVKLDYEGTVKGGAIHPLDGKIRMYISTKEDPAPAKVPESFFEGKSVPSALQ